MTLQDLLRLDDRRPFDPPASIWDDNLTALREVNPELTSALAECALPPHWTAARALDGSPTFRVEAPGADPAWLGGAAAPRTRAEALLAGFRTADQNPALATLAAGAELGLLLERLPKRHAVYVFEPSLEVFAAILRIRALSAEIASGRCILVPPQHEREYLRSELERRPGLLAPGTILADPAAPADRTRHVVQLCQEISAESAAVRTVRLRELSERRPRRQVAREGPRVALLALSANPRAHHAARRLHAAARALGWAALACIADGPDRAHGLPHCEALDEFAPTLTIAVDHSPVALPIRPAGTLCRWHLSATNTTDPVEDSGETHLAASPAVVEALRAAGISAERVIDFWWGCADSALREASAAKAPARVLLVGDLPDVDPARYGIEQPTHKILWRKLEAIGRKQWTQALVADPRGFLQAGEKACGVHLRDPELERRFARILAQGLIPAVVLETILRVLEGLGVKTDVAGKGWSRCSRAETTQLCSEHNSASPNRARRDPAAAVFAGRVDPLTPALLDAAATQIPILLHCPGDVSLTPRLASVLHPGQHYTPFRSAEDLQKAVASALAEGSPLARVAQRTAKHVRDNHTDLHRLRSLASRLGLSGVK